MAPAKYFLVCTTASRMAREPGYSWDCENMKAVNSSRENFLGREKRVRSRYWLMVIGQAWNWGRLRNSLLREESKEPRLCNFYLRNGRSGEANGLFPSVRLP